MFAGCLFIYVHTRTFNNHSTANTRIKNTIRTYNKRIVLILSHHGVAQCAINRLIILAM